MSAAEKAAFGQWIIVFDRGRNLIGRVDPVAGQRESSVILHPCYELLDNKLLEGDRVINIVSVQPICGFLFDVPVRVSDGRLTVIDIEELNDYDRAAITNKIRDFQKQLVEKRSGIKIARPGEEFTSSTKH